MSLFLRAKALPLFVATSALVQAGPTGPFRNTFLANEGQWPQDILYKGRSAMANVALLQNAISFSLVEPEEEEHEGEQVDHHAAPEFIVWNMEFLNMNPGMRVIAEGGEPSVTSYLRGPDPSRWVVHPRQYDRIVYKELHTGIDLEFHIAGLDLEYDYVVRPGADVEEIRNAYTGIEELEVGAHGELIVTNSLGRQVQRAPVAWQVIAGEKRPVPVDFVLVNDTTFGFAAPRGYDPTYDLIIDPLFEMVWASYTRALGSSNNLNYAFGSAMDAAGNVYMTGYADSTFPTTPGSYSGPGNVYPEVYVAKFSADGTTLLYSTYLSGNSSEVGTSIAVDASGRAYITGVVDLNFTGITDFPSTPNAYQPVHDEGSDTYLAVLDPTGSSLVYASFLGGTGGETGYRVVLGPVGIAYISGTTSNGDFPETAATDYPTGDNDVFVAKFDIEQSGPASLIYSVRIGAGPFVNCSAHGLSVDDAGNAYVTGSVQVGFGTSAFPTTPGAYNSVYDGGSDNVMSYLLKLGNTLPVTLEYCTYLAPGSAASVDVDPATGEAFVCGTTYTAQFPTTPGAFQTVHAGATDVFVLRMNSSGSDLVYSTLLGGPGYEQSTDLVVNSADEVYVTGLTYTAFPVSPGAYQEENLFFAAWDLFLAHFNADGSAYGCGGATYIGGSDVEYYGSFYDYLAPDLDLLEGAQDTLSIGATSHSQDFPTTPGVYEENKVNGLGDQPIFFKMTCATVPAAPVAAFNAAVSPTCDGSGTVDFFDESTNGATSWNWSFPGASPATSAVQDPQDVSYPTPGTYVVTLIACNDQGCDTITGDVIITTAPLPVVSLGNDTAICTGGTILLTATSGFSSYAWQWNGNTIPGETNSLSVDTSGVYTILATDTAGCFDADTIVVGLLPRPIANFTYGAPAGPCGSGAVTFTANTEADTYSWDFDDGTAGTGPSIAHVFTDAGTYAVQLTVTTGPCSSSVVVSVDVTNTTEPVALPLLGNDTTACTGTVVTLTAPAGYAGYAWLLDGSAIPGSTNSLQATTGGMYTVTVSDTSGCTFLDSLMVTFVERPIPAFSFVADGGPCSTGTLHFTAEPATGTFTWDLGDGTQATGIEQQHDYASPGVYTVVLTVTNAPCSASTSASVVVTNTTSGPPSGPPNIPNVFSPNGDGQNDCFAPVGMEAFSDCYELVVYNRWGQEVYRSRSNDNCWHGNAMNGEAAPEGVYYYLLTIDGVEYHGHVGLLR